jgi:hypothetical protein
VVVVSPRAGAPASGAVREQAPEGAARREPPQAAPG